MYCLQPRLLNKAENQGSHEQKTSANTESLRSIFGGAYTGPSDTLGTNAPTTEGPSKILVGSSEPATRL